MQNSWMKSATFPCVVGMAYVLAEIAMMSFADTIVSLVVSFVLCAVITAALLLYNRSYDRCGVFTTTICGVASIVVLLDFLMDMQVGIENKTFLMLAVNWLAPVFVCSAARLIDRKRRLQRFEEFFKVASIVFFVIYILSLIALLFFGSANRGYEYRSVNLVPFKTIEMYLTTTVLSDSVKILNLAGNVLIFTPLGFYLSVFSHKIHFFFRVLILLAVPVLVEVLQYVFKTGASDIDDVILNFLGGLLGMFICWVAERLFRRFHKSKEARLFYFKPREK